MVRSLDSRARQAWGGVLSPPFASAVTLRPSPLVCTRNAIVSQLEGAWEACYQSRFLGFLLKGSQQTVLGQGPRCGTLKKHLVIPDALDHEPHLVKLLRAWPRGSKNWPGMQEWLISQCCSHWEPTNWQFISGGGSPAYLRHPKLRN